MTRLRFVSLSAIVFFGAVLGTSSVRAEPTRGPSLPAVPLPPVAALHAGSDFTVFLAPGVSAEVHTLGLRRLWRVLGWRTDGLGTYEEDYTALPQPLYVRGSPRSEDFKSTR